MHSGTINSGWDMRLTGCNGPSTTAVSQDDEREIIQEGAYIVIRKIQALFEVLYI